MKDLIEFIDTSGNGRFGIDAYLYVVEVLLLLESQVGGCGRGEGSLVGEDPKTIQDTQNCATHK